jgi:biotin synthase-like enzyme
MFAAGADATMAGAYLTSEGRSDQQDLEMIRELGLDHGPIAQAEPQPSAAQPGKGRLQVLQPGTSSTSY